VDGQTEDRWSGVSRVALLEAEQRDKVDEVHTKQRYKNLS